jgi:hypothetical protein
MGSKFLFAYLLIFAITLISSCTKTAEGIQGSAGPAGNAGKSITDVRSAITGYLLPVNQFTVTDTVLDSIIVSTVMGDSALSVLTDKTGKFILPNLKSGTYRIMFKKNGYDSIGRDVNHSAGNEDQFIDIIQIDGTQTTTITGQNMQLLLSPFDNVTNYIDMFTSISGPPITSSTMRYMDVYFSSSPGLNAHNYLYMTNTYTHNEGTNQFETQIFFAGTNINSTRFKDGDTVYMKSYIVPPYSFDTSWFDSNSYQNVTYPYVGDSLSNYFIWAI